ncbi:uncharacterized protein LOC129582210 [Paramacrobiotus metropolitanus]|uniref:uncharacterized protein LOC129582210 n=1 Tax=Paramacrobiotus metropolitanus TaxID=2943436 RepID=UPI002445F531|nr:uncharacterized protein LOC129582210 [Paramacrobiotus metropolitanus]
MHDEPQRADSRRTHRSNGVTLTEQLGQIVAEVARDAGIVLWDTVYHDSKEHIHLYDDSLHPGMALRRKAACQLLFALDTRHCQCSALTPMNHGSNNASMRSVFGSPLPLIKQE